VTAKTPRQRHISAHCAAGRHELCHGTVYLWPAEDGRRFTPCECRARGCNHGRRDKARIATTKRTTKAATAARRRRS
jgi:hypothetical protein